MTTNTSRPLSAAAIKRERRDEAAIELRELLPIGSTVHVVLRSVSETGMSRVMTFHVVTEDRDLLDITRRVALVTNNSMTGQGFRYGMRIRGVGMDMAFAAVYELACALHPSGYDLKYQLV